MKGKFLCGCDPESPYIKSYRGVVSSNGGLSFRHHDKDGYEICPAHGFKMYGWATPTVQGPQGNNVIDYRVFTDGKLNNVNWKRLKKNPDTRDLRDSETLGLEILSKRNGSIS